MQRIHFISIGGAVMHNMALCLQELGNKVSGSDDEIFEPSRTRLERAGLLPEQLGWFPEKITSDFDAVILGMHAKQDNPELQRALALNIKVYSFPEYIYEHAKNKKRVVIAGSHGKTTTTAMLMHALNQGGFEFDYLVGSQLTGFNTMVKLSNAPLIVIEGDEYLNSALDPRPKFLFYHAHLAQITGIAWDHINVFPTWDLYVAQFRLFLETLPEKGVVSWYKHDPTLELLMKDFEKNLHPIPYDTLANRVEAGRTIIIHEGREYPMHIFGDHNIQNMAGAMVLAKELGMKEHDYLQYMTSFTGTAKRLERVEHTGDLVVFRDFAHSPSKLKATVDSVKKQFPDKRIIAVFELHTFSSLQHNFLSEYKDSMKAADEAMVFYSPRVIKHKNLPYITDDQVREAFGNVQVFNEMVNLHEHLHHQISPKDVLLLMSSGTFEGMKLDFKA